MLKIVKVIKFNDLEKENRYRTLMCPERDYDFWKGYNEWIDYSNSDEYFEELRYKKDKERKEINISNVKELPF